MEILEIKIDDVNLIEAADKVSLWLQGIKTRVFTIVTPNPEIIIQAQDDPQLRKILNSSDLAISDGVGLRWFAGARHTVPGVKLMEELCRVAAKEGWVVGLYGGRKGVAKEALAKLKKRYPGLKGWAEDPGEINIAQFEEHMYQKLSKDFQASGKRKREGITQFNKHMYQNLSNKIAWVGKKVRTSGTRILFIGLGAPKQEYFINKIQNLKLKLKSSVVLMAVGGSFDELSGKVLPAPELVSRLGLKWLWRLIWQPWRIKRQLRLARFIYLLIKKKYIQSRSINFSSNNLQKML